MCRSVLLSLIVLLLYPQLGSAQDLPSTCVEANGLTWCYNPDACGQACEDVCATFGTVPVADNTTWFEAQNETSECQAISQAFGLGSNVSMASYTYACAADTFGNHAAPGGLNPSLLCSTHDGCPANARTDMDQLGVACGAGSRRSVCPCESPSGAGGGGEPAPTAGPAKPIPTLPEWAMILGVISLALIGLAVLRRRAA